MDWQKIETAPKDGTPVLGFVPGSAARYYVLHFAGEWKNNHYGFREVIWHCFPTHWMPLPAPPQEDQSND